MRCYGVTDGPGWRQEVYESSTREAGARVRQLKRAGIHATACPMGLQVTSVGMVRLTLVNIHGDYDHIPMDGVEVVWL